MLQNFKVNLSLVRDVSGWILRTTTVDCDVDCRCLGPRACTSHSAISTKRRHVLSLRVALASLLKSSKNLLLQSGRSRSKNQQRLMIVGEELSWDSRKRQN